MILDPDVRFLRSPSVIKRSIVGEHLLVPISNSLEGLARLYTLNEVGAHIWDLLDGEHDVGSVEGAVCAAFDVSEAEASTDVAAFLSELAALRLIVRQ